MVVARAHGGLALFGLAVPPFLTFGSDFEVIVTTWHTCSASGAVFVEYFP